MSAYNRVAYLEYLKNMQIDNWKQLSLAQKEKTLQYIVDYNANLLGLPSICHVRIANMKDDSKKGMFDKTTDILTINRKLAVDCLKPPYRKNKDDHILATKDIYETLMHEFEHALQKHAINIIKQYGYDMSVFELNYNNGNHTSVNSTFIINRKNKDAEFLSSLLYHIQPIERDAFAYANKKCVEFNNDMRELFPQDLSFAYSYPFSSFDTSVKMASVQFQTETLFEDIDDIIRVINGIEPNKEINQTMYDAVIKTQSKDFVQKIIDKFNYEELVSDEQQDIEIS